MTADHYEKGVDFRSRMPQFQAEEMEKSRKLLDMLNRLAAEKCVGRSAFSGMGDGTKALDCSDSGFD